MNGQFSDWGYVSAGVPQGSVLGPLLFLIYINDLVHEVNFCNIRLFADDTCLFIDVDNREEAAKLIESDFVRISNWSKKWLVSFSAPKTRSLIISNKNDKHLNPPLTFDNNIVTEVNHHTYLGLKLSSNLKWNEHITDIYLKAKQRLNMMALLKYKVSRKTLEIMYKTFVRPAMEYGIVIWGGTYETTLIKLEEINVNALRIITGATARSNITKTYAEMPLESSSERRESAALKMFYKIKHDLAPPSLSQLIPRERSEVVEYNLRNRDTLAAPPARLESMKRSFVSYATRLWNTLPNPVRQADTLCIFKQHITKKDQRNPLYYYGKRWSNVHHARLRMGCSGLNQHLHANLHVIPSPQCDCGDGVETPFHYFMKCKRFTKEREKLQEEVMKLSNFNLKNLLYGDNSLQYKDNCLLFDAVHKYLTDTKRFM